jgi:hypothetical protein
MFDFIPFSSVIENLSLEELFQLHINVRKSIHNKHGIDYYTYNSRREKWEGAFGTGTNPGACAFLLELICGHCGRYQYFKTGSGSMSELLHLQILLYRPQVMGWIEYTKQYSKILLCPDCADVELRKVIKERSENV